MGSSEDDIDILSVSREEYYSLSLDKQVLDLLKKIEINPRCMDNYLILGEVKYEQKKYRDKIWIL